MISVKSVYVDATLPTVYSDPSELPPYEVCKDCRWECCLALFQHQCWTGTHSAVHEVVVYKDEMEKDLVEIRCPRNYLGMRKKKYKCNHTLHECRHCPVYTCGLPHTEVEEEIWNVWKGTASANASKRTAVSWGGGGGGGGMADHDLMCPVYLYCTPLLHREGFLLKLSEHTAV